MTILIGYLVCVCCFMPLSLRNIAYEMLVEFVYH